LHPKGLGRFVLPPHTPSSPGAYSVLGPQAELFKVSPCSVVCVPWGWYLREWRVGGTNAPATLLPTCCQSGSAAPATQASHCFISSCPSPSLPAGVSAKFPNSAPSSPKHRAV